MEALSSVLIIFIMLSGLMILAILLGLGLLFLIGVLVDMTKEFVAKFKKKGAGNVFSDLPPDGRTES